MCFSTHTFHHVLWCWDDILEGKVPASWDVQDCRRLAQDQTAGPVMSQLSEGHRVPVCKWHCFVCHLVRGVWDSNNGFFMLHLSDASLHPEDQGAGCGHTACTQWPGTCLAWRGYLRVCAGINIPRKQNEREGEGKNEIWEKLHGPLGVANNHLPKPSHISGDQKPVDVQGCSSLRITTAEQDENMRKQRWELAQNEWVLQGCMKWKEDGGILQQPTSG